MSLRPDEREYVIETAVELLRHKHRERLLDVLQNRLISDDYDDEREKALDAIILAVARTIEQQLELSE